MTDKEFFTDAIRTCEGKMYLLAIGIVQNEADAADIMQDAILKAYCNLDQLRNRHTFQPWILSIVHNTAIEFLRKRRDTLDIDSQYDLTDVPPGVDPATKLTVWAAIQQLNQPYRSVIILFYYDNYSVQQIAQITSSSAVTVRQQLSRGRKMLSRLLNKEDFDQ